jgi:hypothetical protein
MIAQKRRGCQSQFRKFGPEVFRRIVPDKVIEEIAERHGPDRRKRKLPVVVHLWLLVVGQLDSRARCLDALIRSVWEGWRRYLGLPADSKGVDKSALSRKNSSRSPAILREVFLWLVGKYRARFGGKKKLPQLGRNVAIIDSTVVDIAARLYRWFFNGGKHRRSGKAQAKIHMLYDADLKVPRGAEVSRGSAHDSKWAKKLLRTVAELTLFLFDRGYWSHALFTWIVRKDHDFVTRLKKVAIPRKVRRLGRGDWLVRFDATPGREIPFVLRMVRWKTEQGETLFFVTSLTDAQEFPPEMIAAMYVWRWEIEIFFRDLKHVLRLKSFLSYSANGIRLQVYAALIAYVLLKYLRACAALASEIEVEELSFKRVVDVAALWLGAAPQHCYRVSPKAAQEQWDDLLVAIGCYGYCRKRKRESQAGKRRSNRAA